MKDLFASRNSHLITSGCLLFLMVSIFSYMYFLSLSVVHVVMRKEATQEISLLRSEISKMESSYIEAKHQISAKVATLEGFEKNQEKIFINRGETILVLQTSNF